MMLMRQSWINPVLTLLTTLLLMGCAGDTNVTPDTAVSDTAAPDTAAAEDVQILLPVYFTCVPGF
ncbi:MAG: hypothetical protein JRH20_24745 [Deltaproteobacteria bacterium]|nr:hypothetical protein [Deltaproteobacteria bacterium]